MPKNFTKTTLRNVVRIDDIITMHYFEYVKRFRGIGEKHDFWEMVYVDCGKIYANADGKWHELTQGQAIFHHPNEYHNIISENGFSSVFIVTFDSKSPDIDFFYHRQVTLNDTEKELISLMLREGKLVFAGALDIMDQTKLVKKMDAPFGGEQLIQSYLEALLIQIIRHNRNVSSKEVQSQLAKIRNEKYIADAVINILEQHLYDSITLDEICSKVMFSKSYVEKFFARATGYGIVKYFNKLKTDEAKRLISEEKYSFTEIAEKLHFGSIHYFSRTFKMFTGMSPSEYAKSVKARALL